MVVSLFWLFVLTFWGTIAQTSLGLYEAQERFFFSWFFTVGIVPFPGARTILWILFINLLAVTVTRFSQYRKKRYFGLIIIHVGLLFYFVSAFVTFHAMKESNVHLLEKAGTNLSSSYTEWEVAFWPAKQKENRDVIAFLLTGLKQGDAVSIEPLAIKITVDKYLRNALAFQEPDKKDDYLNPTNITRLEPAPIQKQHEENIAGIEFKIISDGETIPVRLYGTEENTLTVNINDKPHFVKLRRKKSPLPFIITLEDFRADFHPGTEMARSYESDVIIDMHGVTRKANISMNEPFRYKDFTIFQAAYAIDDMGREYSTFAVVENKGRLLPYISSFLVFGGLVLHFITMALTRKKYV